MNAVSDQLVRPNGKFATKPEKLADRLCDVRNIDVTMDYDFTNPRFNSYRRKIED